MADSETAKEKENDKKPETPDESTNPSSIANVDTYYQNLIKAQFIGDANQIGENGTEVVDVVTEYQWALNPPNATGDANALAATPFVYAIEYRQKYGATATNLVNNIYAMGNTIKNVWQTVGLGDKNTWNAKNVLTNQLNTMKNTIAEATSSYSNSKTNTAQQSTETADKKGEVAVTNGTSINADNLQLRATALEGASGLLDPYKHLYVLEPTKKRFCFPMMTDSAALSISNDFGSTGQTGMLSAGLTKTVDAFADNLMGFASDIQDISNYLSSTPSTFVMYNIEKAKAFSFPTTGKTISIKFPLFNTTKVDAWKDNYKFIVLFALRNMLFRRDNVTYYPPLIYDVTTAGWGRMPLSFVKQFSVKSCGMIRTLQFDNSLLNIGTAVRNQNTTVNVPEAWIVDIQFQSLVADSANQFLSSIVDLPITSKPVTYNT